MAARKKDDALAAFTVVLEDIRSQIKVICESQQGLRETMDARFDAVDRRFDGIDARFDGVDARFDGVDARFDGVDARLDRAEGDLALVKAAVLENSRDLKDLRVAVTRKVDRDEVEAIVAHAVGR